MKISTYTIHNDMESIPMYVIYLQKKYSNKVSHDMPTFIIINVSFTTVEHVFAATASFLFNGKVKDITGAYIAQHLVHEIRFVNNLKT